MASTSQDDSTTDPPEKTTRSCSTMDHIYKVGLWTDRVEKDQKCLCGLHRWGREYKNHNSNEEVKR